jgi:uncharacterized protein (DUF3820 family)
MVKVIDESGIMLWGKHKGANIEDLKTQDPEYVWWLMNQDSAKEDPDFMEVVSDFKEPELRLWFGKYKGMRISAIDSSYLRFIKEKLPICRTDKRLKKALQNY